MTTQIFLEDIQCSSDVALNTCLHQIEQNVGDWLKTMIIWGFKDKHALSPWVCERIAAKSSNCKWFAIEDITSTTQKNRALLMSMASKIILKSNKLERLSLIETGTSAEIGIECL